MKKSILNEFLEKYITTVLHKAKIYPEYCFERKLSNEYVWYQSQVPLLTNYIQQFIQQLPSFTAFKIQIQELPTLQPQYEWILLNSFDNDYDTTFKNIFQSLQYQQLPYSIISHVSHLTNQHPTSSVLNNGNNSDQTGKYTFQFSILSDSINSQTYTESSKQFFGSLMSLQPINSEKSIVLFKNHVV